MFLDYTLSGQSQIQRRMMKEHLKYDACPRMGANSIQSPALSLLRSKMAALSSLDVHESNAKSRQ